MKGSASSDVPPKFGAVHRYVPPPVPLSCSVILEQIGELLVAVIVGKALTVAETLAVAVQLFASVTCKVYVPPFTIDTLITSGFCTVEENESGPVHK
jgi:hypothetical protein